MEEVFVIEYLNGEEDFNDGATTFYEQELCEKCPYSELFWSAFSRIWTENYVPEKLRIRTLFCGVKSCKKKKIEKINK